MAFVRPLDVELLKSSARKTPLLVTLEDNVITGGAGQEIDAALINEDVKIINIGWPDKFIEHGTCDQLYEKYGMDGASIAERIIEELARET